jgi:hypothetical protein
MTCEALKAGALTVLDKPLGANHPNRAVAVRWLVDTVSPTLPGGSGDVTEQAEENAPWLTCTSQTRRLRSP